MKNKYRLKHICLEYVFYIKILSLKIMLNGFGVFLLINILLITSLSLISCQNNNKKIYVNKKIYTVDKFSSKGLPQLKEFLKNGGMPNNGFYSKLPLVQVAESDGSVEAARELVKYGAYIDGIGLQKTIISCSYYRKNGISKLFTTIRSKC